MAVNFNSDKEQNFKHLNSGINFISASSNLGITNRSCFEESSYDSSNNLTGAHTWDSEAKNDLLYKKTLRYDSSNNLTGVLLNKNISETAVFDTTISNGFFYSDCEEKKSIYARWGDTVIFNQFDPSNSTHSLKISNTNDGSHNGGSDLLTPSGANYAGTPGSNGTTSFKAPVPGDYYYYCTVHSGMGGLLSFSAFEPFPIIYLEHNTYNGSQISESTKNRIPKD